MRFQLHKGSQRRQKIKQRIGISPPLGGGWGVKNKREKSKHEKIASLCFVSFSMTDQGIKLGLEPKTSNKGL